MTLLILFLAVVPAHAGPSDPTVETERSSTLRGVYFPFLVLGHGLLLIAKYGIGYPLYYTVKPLYDVMFESSEDPHEISRASGSPSPAK